MSVLHKFSYTGWLYLWAGVTIYLSSCMSFLHHCLEQDVLFLGKVLDCGCMKISSFVSELMYSIEEVSGKGKGLIATRTIPMGTCILSKEPMIRFPKEASATAVLRASIRKQIEALTTSKRKAFLSMHNIYTNDATSPHLGIIRTNSLPFGDRPMEAGIFINASRINHACHNNAQKGWNENANRHIVYTK